MEPAAEPEVALRISVIVPFRNAARWLAECLDALEIQTIGREAFEIIAVDNGSADGSADIARAFRRVRVETESVVGSYAARNRGVSISVAPILAFTDADCVPQPDWLEAAEAALADPAVEVVLGQRLPAAERGALALWNDYECAKQTFVFSGSRPESYYGHTNNMAVRRSTFERSGRFQIRARGSDTIFVREVVDAAGCPAVTFCPDMRVRHLELDGLPALLGKLFVYGRSSASYRRVIAARPLRYCDRWRIYRRTIKSASYSPARALALLSLLVLGVVAWTAGSGSRFLFGGGIFGCRTILSKRS